MAAPSQADRSKTPDLQAYPFQAYDKLRYADTDRQGHVNNAVFSTFLETGRTELLFDPSVPPFPEKTSFVIARVTIDYLAEAHWPGRIDIGTGITKVGNSSLRFYQGLFQDGRCVATAESVIVQTSTETRRSLPLSDRAKAFFENLLMTAEQPA